MGERGEDNHRKCREDGGMGKVRFIFILTGHGRMSLCGQRAPPVGRTGHCSRFELYNLKRKSEKKERKWEKVSQTHYFAHTSVRPDTEQDNSKAKNVYEELRWNLTVGVKTYSIGKDFGFQLTNSQLS